MMRPLIPALNKDRFARWAKLLNGSNATAIVTIGVGHDERAGQTVICTLEDIPTAELLKLLRNTVAQLESQGENS